MRLPISVALLLFAGCQSTPTGTQAPLYYDIGVVTRKITTPSPEAQLWFDRGLAMTYGFNHEEAIRCFEKSLEADPSCAMAYWGKAYAAGPNYNNTAMTPESCRTTYDSVQKAAALSNRCSPVERDLIEALTVRYPSSDLVDRPPVEKAYAEAMRKVHGAHTNDADVCALTAEALMMVRPWKLWTPGGKPAPEQPEIRQVLETGLARWPDHPGLCHLYIHAMEAGPEVERAMPAAKRLESLVPGAGHLRHMPSHVYVWTGRYDDVIRVNQDAVATDRAYAEYAGRNNFYTLYRLHNYHFLAYGAMWEGRREIAINAARQMLKEIPDELLTNLIDFLDIFTATPYHVMVRFGMWNEILAEPEPAEKLLAARACWRYARGIAHASLGHVAEAEAEQVAFRAAKAAVPETRVLFNNSVAKILEVAGAVLAGEIEYRRGNYEPAFAHLRRAVALDEEMNYDEPWGWMEPARHALGALLTEQGRYEEAEKVYRANLKRYPENGWALYGLAECLEGMNRKAEAVAVNARFEKAWSRSDTKIIGSCFCKTKELMIGRQP